METSLPGQVTTVDQYSPARQIGCGVNGESFRTIYAAFPPRSGFVQPGAQADRRHKAGAVGLAGTLGLTPRRFRMDAFLTAFWPNAAATLVGVVLGLPIALWVNRLSLGRVERATLKVRAHRVDHALRVLIGAMEGNHLVLREYAAVLDGDRIKWRLGLDLSAWDATKSDFIAELTDPSLRREAAFHFSQLSVFERINQEYLQFVFGTNASMSDAQGTRAVLKQNLREMCDALCASAENLVTSSKSTQAALAVLKGTGTPND